MFGTLLRAAAGRALVALATGWMVMYPSEFLFWSVFPADYSVPVFLMTLTAYTILGRVLLAVLQFCSVRSLAGLFLAGAIYGWTAEGVVVGTMYDDFPINLIWTGVAWHGLLSVVLVWFFLRTAALWSWPRYGLALIASGLLFGTWAAFWPHERPEFPAATGVLWHGLVASCGFVCAQIIYDRIDPRHFAVSRTEAVILALIVVLVFAMQVTARMSPIVAVYPLLSGLILYFLVKGRDGGNGRSLIVEEVTGARASIARRAALLIVPVTVAASFAATRWIAPAFPTNQLYYFVTIAAGTVLLLAAMRTHLRTMRARRHALPPRAPERSPPPG